MNIKQKLLKLNTFPDSFTFNKERFIMSHYDMQGHQINYEGNKGTTIETKTIISRYDENGRFNKKCLEWLVVDIY